MMKIKKRFSRWISLLIGMTLIFAVAFSSGAAANSGGVPPESDKHWSTGALYQYFVDAGKELQVPVDLLLAVSYGETRWYDHNGEPSQLNGYGVMHLADNPTNQSLNQAAQLLNVPVDTLKTDIRQNIRGGASVLAKMAKEKNSGKLPKQLGDWYTTVAAYSGISDLVLAKSYADEVYRLLNVGASRVIDGRDVYIEPRKVTPNLQEFESVQPQVSIMSTPDYPGAIWNAASSSNYTVANRESDGNIINYVIIHTTQGSYSGAISWFKNPSAGVSAHYVIRSSDGQITQMVQHKDIAWHAGNWTYNQQSIGIEHEGFVSDPSWYTDSMYRSSAALTKWLCDYYGIPKDRTHIIGHYQVPGSTHTDPGQYWDWNYYMSLINPPLTEIIVDNADSANFTASTNWGPATWNTQKYGSDYRFATPQAISDSAWFKANIPATGTYDVYAWWPSNSGYNTSTPFIISTSTGNQTVTVNQTLNGGKWNLLGTFTLNSGTYNVVGVSRWTSGTAYVMADAVKIVTH
jgi:N-acetyl-anhydromuramyl-L-alanine amidase AmpD